MVVELPPVLDVLEPEVSVLPLDPVLGGVVVVVFVVEFDVCELEGELFGTTTVVWVLETGGDVGCSTSWVQPANPIRPSVATPPSSIHRFFTVIPLLMPL